MARGTGHRPRRRSASRRRGAGHFGLMGQIVVDGVRRRLWAFIVTLSCSRYQFVWPCFTQTVEDVCAVLDAAWTFFGGVVRRLVLENASSMIVRADAQSPTLQRAFVEYVQLRGIFADPPRVGHPRDKARIENQVSYVRERWFEGDLAVVREHAARWCREIAASRSCRPWRSARAARRGCDGGEDA